ncbi:staygreen family protein [Falsibacillus pallidus]|uniref:Staygreen protein n=1 Tax=Falsibacillus pallidus TaxID=493781 RepID=A0A370GQA6_9BACI|nr:staygreen family protein [Falsibacillus pallidus]RDI45857.1 staygreen protein [Falsibacillus pallidus]
MREFHPEKLSVLLLPPATPFFPVEGRKYTLTHSDLTGDMFLSAGCQFDFEKVNMLMRDEVLAEWVLHMGQHFLQAKVHISSGEYDENHASVRYMIFQKELSIALKAIANGDRLFYTYFPWLLDMPIYVEFESIYPAFQQIQYFGTIRQYLAAT